MGAPLERSTMARVMQARASVCLGLSLTAVMATVLFLLVFINPKEDNYGTLPLVYSGLSAMMAVIMYVLSLRFESQQLLLGSESSQKVAREPASASSSTSSSSTGSSPLTR